MLGGDIKIVLLLQPIAVAIINYQNFNSGIKILSLCSRIAVPTSSLPTCRQALSRASIPALIYQGHFVHTDWTQNCDII